MPVFDDEAEIADQETAATVAARCEFFMEIAAPLPAPSVAKDRVELLPQVQLAYMGGLLHRA